MRTKINSSLKFMAMLLVAFSTVLSFSSCEDFIIGQDFIESFCESTNSVS